MSRFSIWVLIPAGLVGLFLFGALLRVAVGGPDHDPKGTPATREPGGAAAGVQTAGLSVTDGGDSLRIGSSTLGSGVAREFRFAIVDGDGKRLRSFDEVDGAQMHLFVIGSDLRELHHEAARLEGDGRWSANVAAERPGAYRVVADYVRGGRRRTLGTDVLAPGNVPRRTAPRPSTVATVDGYEVKLTPGRVRALRAAELEFTISRDGSAVTDLETIHGGLGYFAAVRSGDLALVHGTLRESDPAQGRLTFAARFPAAARYRLFVQFRVGGAARTAPLSVDVER